ncbi:MULTISPECIES: LysR substrate-binding domain-containing protein [unclassified Methylobacterium]|uniref:LysR substrate-binding domain-containing protein n=1 Tax=unclassified Methylobacterium TaxID=2615210 RepID=UPI002269C9AE|nr:MULTISPECIES: LysR substrate-binding domain-containing protein [unclassified Methylobacterium]
MNLSGLSLRDLEYVIAVADEGHFSRAAERCNISQPTLSVQIRKLETALGVVLFERSKRRILLTEAGQVIVRQARVVLVEAQRLLAFASEGRGSPLTGRLILAAIQTLGPYLFPLVLRPLREEYPLLTLSLRESRTADIVEGLRDGRIDAALVSLPVPQHGLTASPLFIEPFWLACPAEHALARGGALSATEIAGPDLLLLDEGNCLRDQAIAACGAGSSIGRHATSLETLRSMVAAGAGYTLLPALAVPAGPDPSGLIVTRAFDLDGPGRTIALVWRTSDPRAPGLSSLAAFFRAHAPPGTAACRDMAPRI